MRTLLYIIYFLALGISAQELPPIQNFTPQDYGGENQNWAITQDADKHIYVANNLSLLDYNGVSWRKYDSPNNSIIRSVHSDGPVVFTGQYMEFGFWKRNIFGELNYTSISSQLKVPMVEDEEFWNIVTLDSWVLFQSLDRIYSYNINSKEFQRIEVKSTKAHIYKVDDAIYFQNQNKGIYKIENGIPVLIIEADILGSRNVVGMYEEQESIVIILDNGQFLQLTNEEITTSNIELLKSLRDLVVYSTKKLNDGSYILGTISNGIYQLNSKGDLIRSISRRNGLYNNTILSIFQDNDDNLWLGLDNGVSVINMNSPFNEYTDNAGSLGLVYASRLFNKRLYLGTNQGLFVKKVEVEEDFELISGTEGQVWSLEVFDNQLFCGHNNGTYIISDSTSSLISSFPGTWAIKEIKDHPGLLLQGNFNGLSILEKKEEKWLFRNKIEGFDISSRFFEITAKNKILVNHEIKGLYSLSVDEGFNRVNSNETHSQMGYSSSLVKYGEKIIYTTVSGAFVKDNDSLQFTPDVSINNLLIDSAGGITSIVLPDFEANRLWYFTKKGLSILSPRTFSNSLGINTIPIPSFFRRSLGVAGFENISRLGEDKYLIGISNGFVTLDLEKRKEVNYNIKLSEIKSSSAPEVSSLLALSEAAALDFEANSISFSYTVSQYEKYAEVLYQYRLQGAFDSWSAWQFKPNVSFYNLDFGDYEFEVRAKIGNTRTKNIASYTFVIDRPWYLSFMALLMYGIAILIFFFAVHRSYKSYYTNKQKRILADEKKKLKRRKLKTEKELVQLKNEKLKGEIESKSRELAVSTMSIIKKNEFLNTIKNQLQKAENPTQIRSVIKTIDRNITNDDDWKFFEEAFNNADKNFLKKVKELHPELTSNDLRLCAYLRLNLSSKEIAPLLNISVKSVEVKRYRLRKKMNLDHEDRLIEYLLGV